MNQHLTDVRKLMELARCEAAEKAFAWEAVEMAIRAAAAAGADTVTIKPASPLKIRHTSAAINAAAELQRRGFRVRWADGERPAQGGPAGDVLEIAWS